MIVIYAIGTHATGRYATGTDTTGTDTIVPLLARIRVGRLGEIDSIWVLVAALVAVFVVRWAWNRLMHRFNTASYRAYERRQERREERRAQRRVEDAHKHLSRPDQPGQSNTTADR